MSSFRLRAHIVSFDRHLRPARLRRDEETARRLLRGSYGLSVPRVYQVRDGRR
jgi:hypothetical protein